MGYGNMLLDFWTLALCIVTVNAVNESRIDEGYSVGFLSDCPGSDKPANLTPKTLKKLFVSVMGPGQVLNAKWTPYNYYQIRKLANHPHMDFKKKTFLYVGGYLDSTVLPIGRTLGEHYKAQGYNVLILDTLEVTANYFPLAARFVRPAGKYVAEMLAKLTEVGLDPGKLELLGLSLGGQLMSFIAKNYREISGRNISTLIALDPSGPCFRHLSSDQRLDPSDADFVIEIVTNMNGFGMAAPLGHATFYVNGGEYQPGDVTWLPCPVICSHIRSYFIWLSALMNPNKLVGVQCDSLQHARRGDCYDRKPLVTNTLGFNINRTRPGIYYLPTSNRFPYLLEDNEVNENAKLEASKFRSFSLLDLLRGK